MATVPVRQARTQSGSTRIQHGVHVEIADGEFVGLVGPSGRGKSTLPRMTAGLEKNARGWEIAIGGCVVYAPTSSPAAPADGARRWREACRDRCPWRSSAASSWTATSPR